MWQWEGKSLTWILKRYVSLTSAIGNIHELFFSPYICGDGLFPFLQGIVFLVENELLRHTPEDIAQFLYKGEGLNKTAIGDYLGERCMLPKYII